MITLSLAHFCEVHGPNIVFTTQRIPVSDIVTLHNVTPETNELDVTEKDLQIDSDKESQKLNKEVCGGCTGYLERSGLITFSDTEGYNVASSQHPINYSNLRNSCVRALSCELCPGKEGPVIFGTSLKRSELVNSKDEETIQEWTLSYVFKLKDIKARGYSRVYTLLLILQDFPLLLSLYDLIIKSFEKLIYYMQSKSDEVFSVDSQELQTSSSVRAPLRTHGLFRREAGSSYLRSLTDLLNDANFFIYLHSYFTYIIHSIHLKVNQKLLTNNVYNNINNNVSSNYSSKSLPTVQFLQCYSDICYAMGADTMRCLLWNLFIGNQIILRTESRDQQLIEHITLLIENLIPKNCRKTIIWPVTYKEIYECNLLVIDMSVVIPDIADIQNFGFVVDIIPTPNAHYPFQSEIKCGEYQPTTLGVEIERILKYKMLPANEVARIKLLLDEWKSYAKLFHMLSLQVDSPKDPKIKKFQEGLRLADNDLLVLRFFRGAYKRKWLNKKLSLK